MNSEASLKPAIRKLIHSSQVKPEAVQVIVEGLENEDISSEYWENLFNNEGAEIAIKQKIYSPQMVRLMTLRAMVIPETLPQFLEWLNIQTGKKLDEHQTVSLEFQSKISGYLKAQIIYGIEFLLIELLQEQITPERVAWLFRVKGSAWGVVYQDFIDLIKYDVNLIGQLDVYPKDNKIYLNKLKFDRQIWSTLVTNWLNIKQGWTILRSYYPLAQLFESTEDYKLAVFFYQVSCGGVPKNILSKMPLDPINYKYRQSSVIIYGLHITRKATLIESTSSRIIDFISYIKRGIIDLSQKTFNFIKIIIKGIIDIIFTLLKWIFQISVFLFYMFIILGIASFGFQNFGVFFIIFILSLIGAGSKNN
jgi:hypothetical protein